MKAVELLTVSLDQDKIHGISRQMMKKRIISNDNTVTTNKTVLVPCDRNKNKSLRPHSMHLLRRQSNYNSKKRKEISRNNDVMFNHRNSNKYQHPIRIDDDDETSILTNMERNVTMSPPQNIYRQGSMALWQAMERGEVQLSLPNEETISLWMNQRHIVCNQKQEKRNEKGHHLSVTNDDTPTITYKCDEGKEVETLLVDKPRHDYEDGKSSIEDTFDQDRYKHPFHNVLDEESKDDQGNSSTKNISFCIEIDSDEDAKGGISSHYFKSSSYQGKESASLRTFVDLTASSISTKSVSTSHASSAPPSASTLLGTKRNQNNDCMNATSNDEEASDRSVDTVNSNSDESIHTTESRCQLNKNIPTTRFADIIGHQSVKLRLEEVLLPLKLPSNLVNAILKGIRSLPASVLLTGPPGTGKTLLAQALAGEAQAAFLPIGPSDVLSKYVGESEATMKSIFTEAIEMAKQTDSKCTVLFFDEIDALGQSRGSLAGNTSNGGPIQDTGSIDACSRRVLAELLIQLNRINSNHGNLIHDDSENVSDSNLGDAVLVDAGENFSGEKNLTLNEDHEAETNSKPVRVLVLAATNRPEDCDPALIRRFAVQVVVGLPRTRDRKKMLKRHIKEVQHSLTNDNLELIAQALEGWSGSDIESLSHEVAMAPVREGIRAAARMKRRKRQRSTDQGERTMIYHFTKLRSVDFQDYVMAIKKWDDRLLYRSENEMSAFDKLGAVERDIFEHYDSSSDEEESD